jgi:hypothetical protein
MWQLVAKSYIMSVAIVKSFMQVRFLLQNDAGVKSFVLVKFPLKNTTFEFYVRLQQAFGCYKSF